MSKPSQQEALVYLMVILSASDRDMGDEELARIGAIVRTLPAFQGFAQSRTLAVAQDCQLLLQEEAGFAGVLDLIAETLSPELRETAYALAVDIAAADLDVKLEEDRVLQLVRERFDIERGTVLAIERAARIRHRRIA
ncbi:MAG: tellurite resistance TerB family protein [Aquamicrobium sp.]|uniref:tellurite resistance TerB family protein n=1 Tax=Aquamicrobium sp. TaxID=1872579 RepID=UPI00349E4D61|nr:tellurite resistance TerB family protein [Aquamicrobium sp.]